MATILDKAQTLISANLHSILDKALKANSLAVLDEYIRQAQDNLGDLEDAAATVGGQVKTLKRKTEEFEKKSQKLDRDIDLLLQRSKEDLAIAAQRKMNNVQQMAQEYREQWERQQKEYQVLLDARLKLEAKLREVKAKQQAVRARRETASSRMRVRRTVYDGRVEEAFQRFEQMERRVDSAEGEVESMDLGRGKTLAEEIADLEADSAIEEELAQLRARIGQPGEQTKER